MRTAHIILIYFPILSRDWRSLISLGMIKFRLLRWLYMELCYQNMIAVTFNGYWVRHSQDLSLIHNIAIYHVWRQQFCIWKCYILIHPTIIHLVRDVRVHKNQRHRINPNQKNSIYPTCRTRIWRQWNEMYNTNTGFTFAIHLRLLLRSNKKITFITLDSMFQK